MKNSLTFKFSCAAILFFVLLMFRGSCADKSQAIGALEAQGFSSISITKHDWFLVGFRGCGGDAAKFSAKAINSVGKKVTLHVCVGWPFKGATIRH